MSKPYQKNNYVSVKRKSAKAPVFVGRKIKTGGSGGWALNEVFGGDFEKFRSELEKKERELNKEELQWWLKELKDRRSNSNECHSGKVMSEEEYLFKDLTENTDDSRDITLVKGRKRRNSLVDSSVNVSSGILNAAYSFPVRSMPSVEFLKKAGALFASLVLVFGGYLLWVDLGAGKIANNVSSQVSATISSSISSISSLEINAFDINDIKMEGGSDKLFSTIGSYKSPLAESEYAYSSSRDVRFVIGVAKDFYKGFSSPVSLDKFNENELFTRKKQIHSKSPMHNYEQRSWTMEDIRSGIVSFKRELKACLRSSIAEAKRGYANAMAKENRFPKQKDNETTLLSNSSSGGLGMRHLLYSAQTVFEGISYKDQDVERVGEHPIVKARKSYTAVLDKAEGYSPEELADKAKSLRLHAFRVSNEPEIIGEKALLGLRYALDNTFKDLYLVGHKVMEKYERALQESGDTVYVVYSEISKAANEVTVKSKAHVLSLSSRASVILSDVSHSLYEGLNVVRGETDNLLGGVDEVLSATIMKVQISDTFPD